MNVSSHSWANYQGHQLIPQRYFFAMQERQDSRPDCLRVQEGDWSCPACKNQARLASSWEASCVSLVDVACTSEDEACLVGIAEVESDEIGLGTMGRIKGWCVLERLRFTYLMIVRASIRSRADSTEAPSIDKSIERMIIAIFKKERHD